MGIKHRRVFQPLAIEIWGLDAVAQRYCEIAESINLYSHHRGINRFAGLAMAFEQLCGESADANAALEGWQDLKNFVNTGLPLSAEAIRDYVAQNNSAFLIKVLDWSKRCDELYAKVMEEDSDGPFPLVTETLSAASKDANITVISSSSRESLLEDWGSADLLELTDEVAGQEMGNKVTQLRNALNKGGFAADKALMLGDAIGDLDAAQATGILFFPILPGSEAASWQRLQSEALPRFFSGTYAGEYAAEQLAQFKAILSPDETTT